MADVAVLQTDTNIDLPARPSQNFWLEVLRNLRRNRSAMIGAVILGFLLVMAVAAPIIATHDPLLSMIGIEEGRLPRKEPCIPIFAGQSYETDIINADGSAGTRQVVSLLGSETPLDSLGAFGCTDPLHWMGLDLNARDLFSRLVYGARISLRVGITSVIISIIAGTLLGLFAGYLGGWTDNIIMRLMDVMLAFPGLLLAITFVTIWGPGLDNALVAISIVFIPAYARVTRASVLAVKESEFVVAINALGASPLRIIFLHILPHALTPMIVQATLGIGTAILDAAALSFLGLGAQPPEAEWGQMLSEGRAYIFTSPHLVFFPGIAIMLTVLGFNLLGDGLRDALDPRLNRNQ